MPVWPDNNVMISPALAYASGIQFDLIGRFIQLEEVKTERHILVWASIIRPIRERILAG